MRIVLWLVFLLVVPVPYFLVDVGWVPTLRLLVMVALTASIAVTEGGLVPAVIAIFLGLPALIAVGALWWIAGLTLTGIDRVVPPGRRGVALVVLVAALAVVSLFPIYTTPLSNVARTANLFGLLQ